MNCLNCIVYYQVFKRDLRHATVISLRCWELWNELPQSLGWWTCCCCLSVPALLHPWSSSIILNHPHTLFLQSWHKLSLSEKILMINASGMVSSGFDAFQSLLQHACLRSFVRSYGKLNGTEDSMSLQRMDKQIKKLITLVWSNNALDLMIFLDSIYNADNIIYTTL